MHKRITTVITAVATVCLLSSCTATGLFGQAGPLPETGPKEEAPAPSAPDAGSESAQEDVPAFHFASGDLVLGDFDYEAIKDNLFNPCEEISAEEFAAVGFEPVKHQYTLSGGGIGCGLVGRDVNRGYTISTSSATRRHIQSRPEDVVNGSASTVLPGLVTYRGAKEGGFGCVAAVDTARGQFSVAVGQGLKPAERDELCASAVEIIEEFYEN